MNGKHRNRKFFNLSHHKTVSFFIAFSLLIVFENRPIETKQKKRPTYSNIDFFVSGYFSISL